MDTNNYHDKLFPYAYNILGSAEDAKDAVQDVLIKYLTVNKDSIENEVGYLVKSVINQSINLRNKRNKVSYGVWLPEPFATENTISDIDSKTILTYSMLVLLENLTAKERAVFILKEAFEYSHQEIADTIAFSVENSRKLLSRAKNKLAKEQVNKPTHSQQDKATLENYLQTIQSGDITQLEKLLSNDISLSADGGEKIRVVKDLTTGKKATSKLLMYVYQAFLQHSKFEISKVNHQPAILFYKNNRLYNCQVFDFDIEKNIKNIYSIVDPDKLKSIA